MGEEQETRTTVLVLVPTGRWPLVPPLLVLLRLVLVLVPVLVLADRSAWFFELYNFFLPSS
jgi:hypothetical protein